MGGVSAVLVEQGFGNFALQQYTDVFVRSQQKLITKSDQIFHKVSRQVFCMMSYIAFHTGVILPANKTAWNCTLSAPLPRREHRVTILCIVLKQISYLYKRAISTHNMSFVVGKSDPPEYAPGDLISAIAEAKAQKCSNHAPNWALVS